MASYQEDVQEILQAVRRVEPQVQASIRKRFWRKSWYVRVVRKGGVTDYEDIHHYWLERGLISMFGGGR